MSKLKIITVGGMIGVGKTTLITNIVKKLRAKNKNVRVVYELWEDKSDNVFDTINTYDKFMNTCIEMYYENIENEHFKNKDSKLHMFHINKLFSHQIHFLSTRTTKVFNAINLALENDLDYLILDRTLYEDIIFSKVSLKVHPDLWKEYYYVWNMWEARLSYELDKYNTYHFLLDAPIDTIIDRIHKRGREVEQADSLIQYFKDLNQDYVPLIIQEFEKKKIENYKLLQTERISSESLSNVVVEHYLGS